MPFAFRRRRDRAKKKTQDKTKGQSEQVIKNGLDGRSLVFVGLMGAGKSAIGRRVGLRLDMPFCDADTEIEIAAGQKISDIFEVHGEQHFRDREEKVIERLLQENQMVLATGGGAFMSEVTRSNIARSALSIWLRADLDILMERVGRRDHRPLLQSDNPREVMQKLIDQRYPVYEEADITIESRDVSHETIVEEIIEALACV